MTETTSAGCLRAAFQALARGDTNERDRLCDRAKVLLQAEHYSSAVERVLSADFYVTRGGVAVPTVQMANAARVLQ